MLSSYSIAMPRQNPDIDDSAASASYLSSLVRELKRLVSLSTPIMVALAASVLIGLVDTIMIAPLGTNALAAASITTSVMVIFYSALYGLVSVCGVLVAQAFGAKNNDLVSSTVKAGLAVSLIGGLLGVLLMIAALPLLKFLGQPIEVLAIIRPYWIAMSLVLLPFAMFYSIKGLYDATDQAWIGVVFSFVAVLLNIPANWFLIHGAGSWKGLGLLGAGLASFLSQSASFLLAFGFWRFAGKMKAYRASLSVKLSDIILQIREGTPLALGHAGEGGAYSVAGLMLGLFGAGALAANQIVDSVCTVLYMVPLGMSIAVSIRVGQAIGEGAENRLRRIGLAGFITVIVWMSAFAIILLILGDDVARLLSQDPQVIALASTMFIVFAVMQIADGVQATALGALRGMLDNTWPVFVTLICYWLFALPLGYIIAVTINVGPNGIWIGYGVGLVLASVILVWRFLSRTKSA